MQWFLIVTATVAAFLALAVLVGLMLPEGHTARTEARIAAVPERLWEVMTSPEEYPSWRPGVDEVEILGRDPEGPVRWREKARAGSMILEVVERQFPHRLVVRIADTELPFGGTWTYELEPAPEGTRVRITEDGETHNPLLRFMARFVLGYEATMRDYLEGLEKRVSAGGEEDPEGEADDRP